MEKNQYKLCIEVLRRLNEIVVLANIIVIGSWCIPFYKEYFATTKYSPSIKTRDIYLFTYLYLGFPPAVAPMFCNCLEGELSQRQALT